MKLKESSERWEAYTGNVGQIENKHNHVDIRKISCYIIEPKLTQAIYIFIEIHKTR